ncbi:MAG: ATP-binding protein [Candidatus Micrarchaeia archaeon]
MEKKLVEDFFLKLKRVEGIERELKIESVKNKIFCVVGPRKSGKTWFFRMHANNELYVDLQDVAFKGILANEFFEVIKLYSTIFNKSVEKVFIDEVQEMKDWEFLLLSLLNRGYEVFATGSSSKILKKEFSSLLRGKNITFLLLPFSFREFLKAKGLNENLRTFEGMGRVQKLLKDYLLIGGYPEVVLNEEKKDFLWKSYFDEIFYRDFVERHGIKNIELGRLLLEFIFQNFSKEMSINRIKGFLKGKASFTDRTLYEYVEKLQDTLNVFFVDRFSQKVHERLSWPKKIYVADLGITNIVALSEDIGKRMENVVFLELLRKINFDPLIRIYYFKERENEVDFVIKEGLKVKQLIQVTYASSKDEIEKREIKALLKANELIKCKNLLMVTWDFEDEIKINNLKIKCIPLWKWLLS